MEQKKEFTGIFFPREVLEDEDLTPIEKMIYVEISCFKVCYMKNEQLGKRYNRASETISRIISKLKKKNYILEYSFNGRSRGLIALKDFQMSNLPKRKRQDGVDENVKAASPKTSNKDNNKDNKEDSFCETSSQDIKKNEKKEFKPSPSLSRKLSILENSATKKSSNAKNEPTSVDVIKDDVIDLVEDKNETYPPNFNKEVALKKLVAPYKDNNDKIIRPQKHISIIGLFILAKKTELSSQEQLDSVIKRNLRAARELKAYPFKKIIEVMKYLNDSADFKWTLETVSKFIDEDLTKLKSIGDTSKKKILGEDVKIK